MFPGGVLLTSVILSIIGHGHAQACRCSGNWLFWNHNSRCYFSSIHSVSPTKTYFGARRRCQEVGGDLATMADVTEYKHIREDLHGGNSVEKFWIGACWSPSDSKLRYVNGSDVPLNVFPIGSLSQPPALGTVMSSADGILIDEDPYKMSHYVCRKEPCSVSAKPTAWCNGPQQSTASNMDITEVTISEETTTATINNMPRQTTGTIQDQHDTSGFTDTSLSNPTSGGPTDDAEHDEGDEKSFVVYIGIGVGVFLVLAILCVLIVCIIWRKGRKRKANSDYPRENNLNMDTKGTDQPLTTNILTGNTSPSDKPMYEESGYAEVDGHLNEAVSGRTVAAKDVVYDTATAVDIGVARKQDTNDVALYATPVRVRDKTEKEEDSDSSDEENTQIVENTIYGK